jgi:HSP20 family protein
MAEAEIKVPAKSEAKPLGRLPSLDIWRPFEGLHDEIDRLFDNFGRGWHFPMKRTPITGEPLFRREMSWGAVPAVDIVERDKEYEVTAELPGMDESNIDVSLSNGMLTLKGEKKEEKEEKKKDYYCSERRYGSFQRSFPLPEGVDADKIDASFKKGVLTLILPKTADAQKKQKKIPIKAA